MLLGELRLKSEGRLFLAPMHVNAKARQRLRPGFANDVESYFEWRCFQAKLKLGRNEASIESTELDILKTHFFTFWMNGHFSFGSFYDKFCCHIRSVF